MSFKYSKAYNQYGASMGRSNDNPSNFDGIKIHLERVIGIGETVKKSLINHDGYDSRIIVRKARKLNTGRSEIT